MQLGELIVIYLAYGAPFGVYDVIFCQKALSIADAPIVAAKFLFWPAIVVSWIYKWFTRGGAYAGVDLKNQIDTIGNSLESLAFSDRSAVTILLFREVFTRYTGLTLMLMPGGTDPKFHPLQDLLCDEPSQVSAACFKRLDRQRMAFHQHLARKEFLDKISELSATSPAGLDLILNSIELAVALNDLDFARALNGILPDDKSKGIYNPLSVPKPAN